MGRMQTGPYSVAFPRRWWYPVARSSELGRRPLAVMLMDTPLAVFRGAGGKPAVLLDRCAHRNYPLAFGRVTDDGVLECGYHGWTYDGGGQCVRVPGLADGCTPPAHTRQVPCHAAVEPVGMGPIRLREDAGRTFDHWDRFFLPSIAQIEYAVDGWFRIVNTIVHLPMSPFRTRAWFVVRFKSRLPAAVVRPIVLQRGKQILRQDARALARQTERIRSLGGERYASTELDLLGNAIWHLLRQAERAERPDSGDGAFKATVSERTVVFEA